MKLTIKGQVTIPKKYRQRYGLAPHTEVVFEEAPGGVLIRPAGPVRQQKLRRALKQVRGMADAGMGTDEVMRMTRED
ncbi:MAG: AbrB/MazE/SpoVT family DNA-binding domain-containing protein [Puniceicoccaceae bacterium]